MHETTEVPYGSKVGSAPALPLTVRVETSDGKLARRISADGRVEVWVVTEETPPDGAERAGRTALIDGRVHVLRSWVTVLTFANYELADIAAEALVTSCKILTGAMQAGTTDFDDCTHVVEIERFSRSPKPTAVCRRCMTVLADDVDQWWRNVARRGIEADETFAGAPTIAEAIARWANRNRDVDADRAATIGEAMGAHGAASNVNDLTEIRSDPGAR